MQNQYSACAQTPYTFALFDNGETCLNCEGWQPGQACDPECRILGHYAQHEAQNAGFTMTPQLARIITQTSISAARMGLVY